LAGVYADAANLIVCHRIVPSLAIIRDRPLLGLYVQGESGEGARGRQGVRGIVPVRGQCTENGRASANQYAVG
jgi:hypothetical protein